MFELKIIITSTRPGRKGPAVAQWVYDLAKQHDGFNTELIDLAEVNLPFLDEPNHPRIQQYQHEHTREWSRRIGAADAFIIVTAEYNYGYPAPLKNAMDYLYNEWNYKPVALVSYGGIAAGTRAVQLLKLLVTALKMMPLAESVNIPFFTQHIDKEGKFNGNESLDKTANEMLIQLARWSASMKTLRN